jgi:uncharacterized membrane protein AbrB (regulator of aidB expression)
MNNTTMFTADRVTHLKIVVVALVAATAVLLVAVSARFAQFESTTSLQASAPGQLAPITEASRSGVALR